MGKSYRRDNYSWNDDYDFEQNDKRKVKENVDRRKMKRMKNDLRSKNWKSFSDEYED
jgi:hypothetical protein